MAYPPDKETFNEVSPTEDDGLLKYRGHIEPLDSMRGIAIIAVMVMHFFPEGSWLKYYPVCGAITNKFAQMGFAGVELFFVLSGFLVTGILLDVKGMASRAYFTKFYARRILRLYPLYYGTLFVIFFVLPSFTNIDNAAKQLSAQQWRLWLNLTNVPINRPDWDSSQVYSLVHFWFLAVQEQFYLLWPLAVFVFSARTIVQVCFLLMGVGWIARLSNMFLGDASIWFFQWSTVTKIDGLVLGALLAIWIRDHAKHYAMLAIARRAVVALGIVFVVIGLVPRSILGNPALPVVLEPIMALLFGSLLLLAMRKDEQAILPKVLDRPVLRWFGKYSYGLYIVHGLFRQSHLRLLPPDAYVSFFRIPILGLMMNMATCFAVSMMLAYIIWHCYEKRFLVLKKYFEYNEASR